jgi:hypothetical protein
MDGTRFLRCAFQNVRSYRDHSGSGQRFSGSEPRSAVFNRMHLSEMYYNCIGTTQRLTSMLYTKKNGKNTDYLKNKYIHICRTIDSHSGDYEEYNLLGYNVVWSAESV